MNCLVTGAAGFIGSHLCRKLLEEGCIVAGVDSFTDFYPRWMKEKNIGPLLKDPRFTLLDQDLEEMDLRTALKNKDFVFHLAAQPGVRTSWGENFSVYTRNNILSTQRILETARELPLQKVIFASTSSVYGLTPFLPMSEEGPLNPISPYGVTKLAAEQLCFLYFKNFGVPTLSLRLFTVYGPGQRPDMAFHRFFQAVLEEKEITVFGDGNQTRDFTYVDDIVAAHILAMKRGKPGEVYNVGGGHRQKLEEIFPLLEETTGKTLKIAWVDQQKGDVLHTLANIEKAGRDLGYFPGTPLAEGLRREWQWVRSLYDGSR